MRGSKPGATVRPVAAAYAGAMRTIVGIDLAWGERAATGVAVARIVGDDPAGARAEVVTTATVRSDDDIAALVPAGPVVVAIDAPLDVPNETGRRACDAAISRCFGRYSAGAYPANRSIPWLAEPRGGRLAARLGLSLDPRGVLDPSSRVAGARVALEVYPHAATVVLFGLDRILAYKPRRGRGLEDRRAALRTLLAHLATLADASPPLDVTAGPRWTTLVAAVDGAPTMAALDRVEDEVDAHTCAYVGVLAALAPERLAVVGEPRAGEVVTPVDERVRACLAEAV